MELILFASIICLISSIQLIWFKSDAFIEWMKLFRLSKFIKYQEYLDAKLDSPFITYPLFLKTKYRLFIFKILGCPLCWNTWLSLFGALFVAKLFSNNLADFITQTIIYSPIILISSLYIYYKLSKMINENK